MAEQSPELALSAVAAAMSRAAAELRPTVRVLEEGWVLSVGDGVLRIDGLPAARAEEVLAVGGHSRALVLGLSPGIIEAIALDESSELRAGQVVRTTGQTATIPAGPALLGRVVDPLGRPLDGAPLRGALQRVPVERRAPQLHERAAVHAPLHTGILTIDAMFPIGRGQRELILGEEGTGRTSLALDILLRQRDTDVVVVYVGIGRRRAESWQLFEALRRGGGRFVAVLAPEDWSPGLRYLAPYAGTAIAESFAYRGEHALIVYDDLSAHAVAWRELSLLLRRPPGREAYPGDIFYVHARLLERAAQLSVEMGGGSLTALPVARIEGGRLTAYIPTNLISITDGQIVLSRALFAAGQKPAIDVGLSVSRVGARAQPQALRALAAELRLDYAGFLELETFSRLGTRLEEATQRRLEIGRRVRILLRAQRLQPLSVFDAVARLVLGRTHDLLLQLPEPVVAEAAEELCQAARRELSPLVARIDRDAVLSEDDEAVLRKLAGRVVAARRGGCSGVG